MSSPIEIASDDWLECSLAPNAEDVPLLRRFRDVDWRCDWRVANQWIAPNGDSISRGMLMLWAKRDSEFGGKDPDKDPLGRRCDKHKLDFKNMGHYSACPVCRAE